MEDVKAEDEEISNKNKSLHESLDTAFLHQQELEEEVSELTNEVVSTFGVYFEHSKE